jgi:HupE / UreJ protein
MTARRTIPFYAVALAIQAAIALGLVVIPRPASAHEFTMESLMNAFVKIEQREAHFVVRVPLHVLKSARFPVRGSEIDLTNADAAIQRALAQLGHEITIWETDRPLAPSGAIGRLTLPSDRSFERYTDAVAHVARPVAPGTTIYADQGYLDAHLTYAISAPNSRFMIQTAIAPEFKNYLKLAIRYLPLREDGRAMVITSRSGRVALNPTWYQAAAGFVALGIVHILSGVDHLLFLLCLLIPVRSLGEILRIVTAFTVGHSVTLLGSAYDLAPAGAWFPPFVETLIAVSILYMALENILGVDLRRRWLIAGLFGLVHGFGFSYGLKENLQFAGRHLLVSLFSFNVGIEIGQILVLVIMLPALVVLLRHVLVGRIGMIILSAIVAHVAWHWMIERGDVLWKVEWPQLDGAGLAVLARWIAGLLLAAAGVRFFSRRARISRGTALPSLGGGELQGSSRRRSGVSARM